MLLILNPEMIQLALFIDAVGLDVFLMLIEVQFLAFLGLFFNTKIKPLFLYIKNFYSQHALIFSWKNIKAHPKNLMFSVPSPATLMNTLVILVAISVLFNSH